MAAVLVHPIADGWRWSGLGRAAAGSALCSRKEQRKARGKRNSALAAVVREVVAVGRARWAGSGGGRRGREVEGWAGRSVTRVGPACARCGAVKLAPPFSPFLFFFSFFHFCFMLHTCVYKSK